jgi:lupus La protein
MAADNSDLEAKVLKQVEFYFSDSNYPRDKFLRAQAGFHEQGYVPIATIASFARMKALTTDVALIASVAKRSDKLQVSEDGTLIKRVAPVPADDTLTERMAHTKGWPATVTIEQVSAALSQFGKVQSVRLRKRKDKSPKDSAFVEFSTQDELKSAAEAGKVAFEDKEIVVKTKKAWFDGKKAEKDEQKRNKKRKPEGEPQQNEQDDDNKKPKREESNLPKGTIVAVKGMGPETTREIAKEVFGAYGTVAFVDFSKGDTDGYVRMSTAEEAEKVVKECDKELDGKKPELSLVSGEAESEYWKKLEASRNKNKGGKGGRGGRGGKGGRGGRGGRGRGGRGRK